MSIPAKDFKLYHPDVSRIGRLVITNNYGVNDDDFSDDEVKHFLKVDNNFKIFVKMIVNLDNAKIRIED